MWNSHPLFKYYKIITLLKLCLILYSHDVRWGQCLYKRISSGRAEKRNRKHTLCISFPLSLSLSSFLGSLSSQCAPRVFYLLQILRIRRVLKLQRQCANLFWPLLPLSGTAPVSDPTLSMLYFNANSSNQYVCIYSYLTLLTLMNSVRLYYTRASNL